MARSCRAARRNLVWAKMPAEFADTATQLAEALLDLGQALAAAGVETRSAHILARASASWRSRLSASCTASAAQGARAVETTPRGFALTLLPFDVAERFQALLSARRCAWIFTSATLSVGGDFTHFASAARTVWRRGAQD